MNWLKIGSILAAHAVDVVVSLLLVLLAWRKFMLPEIEGTLKEAQKTISTLAGLGGIKKSEWQDINKIENAIGSKIVATKMPELGALKLLLGSEVSEQLDEFIQENPTQAMQLYEKYRHFLPGAQESRETTMF